MIAEWMSFLKILSQPQPLFDSVRLKSIGVIISAVIVTLAIFALRHTLKNVDYEEVFVVVERTRLELIALALLFVIISYASLTLYDLFALRAIGHPEVPYRIAALASFTSYPIAHGIGAVAFVSPVIRYRIYVCNGLGAMDVANICFLTGLTFWLGNLTAFGLSVLYEPAAISQIDYLPLALNRWLAAALLVGVTAFVIWSWRSPRSLGTWRWPVRLPSGPMTLLQIVIGILDLGSAALAMYVLIPASADVGAFQIVVVFIVATLLGFASHTPAGIGVFDATILIGLGGENREPLIAALLMFRFLYHFLPFVLALGLFGAVEGWRSLRRRRASIALSSEVDTGSREESASKQKAIALSSEVDTGSRKESASGQKAESPVLIPSEPESSTPAN